MFAPIAKYCQSKTLPVILKGMLYLLYGSNGYALQTEVARLRKDFVAKYGENGYEQIGSETLSPDDLAELLLRMSLFALKRMVVIKNLSQHKITWDSLEEWVDKIPEDIDVLLVETQPDKRTKVFKTLIKKAIVFVAEDLNEGQIINWIVKESQVRANKKIDRAVAQLLVSRVGLNQLALSQELDKLLLHDHINQALVVALTEPTPQATAFELLDAITAKRPLRVQEIILQLRLSEDPYKMFGLFSSQVFTLAAVVAAGKAITLAQIAKDTGSHPFVISKIAKSASTTSWSEVKEVIEAVATLDDKLKSSGIDPWELLSISLIKIAAR